MREVKEKATYSHLGMRVNSINWRLGRWLEELAQNLLVRKQCDLKGLNVTVAVRTEKAVFQSDIKMR